jgi:hypothetical protein
MSRDRGLERRLQELRAPDEEQAEARAWPVVREAYAERAPMPAPPRLRRLGLVAAGGAAALAIGLSPAGAKVGDFVGDVVGIGEDDAKPQLRSLPAAGELLVDSPQGPWVVREDGSKRLLGDFGHATWSPHGVYVAVADGRELAALDAGGNIRWTFPAPGVVRDPRWGGDAVDTRIAYRSGDNLRVITGDGNPAGDRLIARDVAPIAPAWRPIGLAKLSPAAGSPFVLTYVERGGHVRSVDVETGESVPVRRSDRRRLPAPPAGGAEDRALSPDGSRLARVEHVGASDRLIVSDRGGGSSVLFSAHGRLTGPTWSPDGRRLQIGWPAADQWLFIEVAHPQHVDAFDRIREQFGSEAGAEFPSPVGWVLPQR